MHRVTAAITSLFLIVLALATVAQAARPSLTEAAMAGRFKAHGMTFPDGSHLTVFGGFCNGVGDPVGGTIAHPRYAQFDCELIYANLKAGKSRWYEVLATPAGITRVISIG